MVSESMIMHLLRPCRDNRTGKVIPSNESSSRIRHVVVKHSLGDSKRRGGRCLFLASSKVDFR